MYINIHTHQLGDYPQFSLLNVIHPSQQLPTTGYSSLGIHPWHLKAESILPEFETMSILAASPQVLAIGECGLDKHIDIDFSLQVQAFEWQIALAHQLQKPLIIHCVRAYAECMAALKKATVPVIFHGFNKHPQLGLSLVREGYYLSFGMYLLKGKMDSLLQAMPLEYLFLETDTIDSPIEQLYVYVAALRGMKVEELRCQVQRNFSLLFGFLPADSPPY